MQPTQPLYRALRRLALTTKMVNGGYYKGNRTGSMGRHTKRGGYLIEWHKVRTYIVPAELERFKVDEIPVARHQADDASAHSIRHEEDGVDARTVPRQQERRASRRSVS